jgi:dTDP-4-dehydrorhamnose reductase
MNILVTGAKGQVGRELVKQGHLKGFSMVGTTHHELDITNRHAIENTLFKNNIRLAINAAAYTAVDKAESEPDQAFDVNSNGASFMASACSKANIPLIHISTDYVFNGEKKKPYVETDAISPLGVYGKSKAQGEAEVKNNLKQHIILRTSWAYGIDGHNFVKTMLSLAKTADTIRGVDEQIGCPTSAREIAKAILSIADHIQRLQEPKWGTYHYCGMGTTSWFGFGKKIFEIANKFETLAVKQVVPIRTDEYPTAAKRPANSVLNCDLIHQYFGIIQTPWEQSLEEMITELLTVS